MDYLQYKNYLMHHGVEGQKWGVRRYQNADGSLTPEGRAHYGLGNLDYNARYSGDKKSAVKAYKAERKQLREKVAQVQYDDDEKWFKEYDDFEKGKGNYSNIDPGDVGEWRNAEKDLNAESDAMWNSYQKGLEEVDKYLTGKYGQETIDSYKRGKKAKTIAIGASIVTAAAAVGVGTWYGTKTHKNNEMRKSEDSLYEQAKNSLSDYENAKKNREHARYDELAAKTERDIASDKLYKYYNEPDKESNRIVYDLADKNYQDKKKAAKKAADHQEEARKRALYNTDRYDKASKERAEKTQGFWKRKGDDERDSRYKEFMNKR